RVRGRDRAPDTRGGARPVAARLSAERGLCRTHHPGTPPAAGGIGTPRNTGSARRSEASGQTDAPRLQGRLPCVGGVRALKGKMGQESTLQPAVLELAAHCPASPKNVQPVCSQFCSHPPALTPRLRARSGLFKRGAKMPIGNDRAASRSLSLLA